VVKGGAAGSIRSYTSETVLAERFKPQAMPADPPVAENNG
jgi:hypothetical protein